MGWGLPAAIWAVPRWNRTNLAESRHWLGPCVRFLSLGNRRRLGASGRNRLARPFSHTLRPCDKQPSPSRRGVTRGGGVWRWKRMRRRLLVSAAARRWPLRAAERWSVQAAVRSASGAPGGGASGDRSAPVAGSISFRVGVTRGFAGPPASKPAIAAAKRSGKRPAWRRPTWPTL